MQKTTLKKLFNRKDCLGWAYHTKGRHYVYQNSNDLGIVGDIDDVGDQCKETILRKVKLGKKQYLYILRNNWGYEKDESTATLPAVISIIKECWNIPITKHERKIASKYCYMEEK